MSEPGFAPDAWITGRYGNDYWRDQEHDIDNKTFRCKKCKRIVGWEEHSAKGICQDCDDQDDD